MSCNNLKIFMNKYIKKIIIFLTIALLSFFVLSRCNFKITGEEIPLNIDTSTGLSIGKISSDNKYVTLLVGSINEEKKEYIFDIENEKLYDDSYQYLMHPYKVVADIDKSEFDIVDNKSGKIIKSISADINFIKDVVNHEPLLTSNLKYLYFYGYDNAVFDLETGSIIQYPFATGRSGLSITWSPDCKKAICTNYRDSDRKNLNYLDYLWDVEKGSIDFITDSNSSNSLLNWSPSGKFIWYTDNNNQMTRYYVEDKHYEKDKKLNFAKLNCKWISDKEYIITDYSGQSGFDLTLILLFGIDVNDYFYVKKISNGNEVKNVNIRVLGKSPIIVFWSLDNKYVYYIDNKKLYKAKINMGK